MIPESEPKDIRQIAKDLIDSVVISHPPKHRASLYLDGSLVSTGLAEASETDLSFFPEGEFDRGDFLNDEVSLTFEDWPVLVSLSCSRDDLSSWSKDIMFFVVKGYRLKK